jgi:hypothetical protein
LRTKSWTKKSWKGSRQIWAYLIFLAEVEVSYSEIEHRSNQLASQKSGSHIREASIQ